MKKSVCLLLSFLFILPAVFGCAPSPVQPSAPTVDAEVNEETEALYKLGIVKEVSVNHDGSVYFGCANELTCSEFAELLVRMGGSEGVLAEGVDGSAPIGYVDFISGILELLGYSGVYDAASPYSFAKKLGLIDSDENKNTILKSDAYKICYNALYAEMKNKSNLGKTLVEKGAFTSLELDRATVLSGKVLKTDVSSVKFSVLNESIVYQPESRLKNLALSYGAMTVLEHNGKNNGTVFATFNAGNTAIGSASGFCYKILKSIDCGKTWDFAGSASDDFNTALNATYAISTPALFELPEDIGEFKAGTLFLAGVSKDGVKTSEISVSAITLYYSTDLGATWTAYSTIDKAGGKNEGVWEPFLICDGGKVFCFYSDDSDPDHSQKIVYKWTSDLVNWHGADGVEDCTVKPTASTTYGEPFDAVACTNQKLRPGMASVVKMNNGKFLMTFEMVGIEGSPVYYKTTDDLADWSKIASYGKPVGTFGNRLGGAPWVAYTPLGGECGTLIVGAFRNAVGESKYSDTCTDLYISTDHGKTWSNLEHPIPYTIVPKTTASDAAYYRGYSPKLLVSADGTTLYCLNVTEYPNNEKSTRLQYARIRITETGTGSEDGFVSGTSDETADTAADTAAPDTAVPDTAAPDTTVEYAEPSAYKGKDYKFDINGQTVYAHSGTWELVDAEGEDKGALHLVEGKGIALVHDIDYSKNVTITAKVKLGAGAKTGNFGYVMNAWWNEDGDYDKNWEFFEKNSAGYFYCYLSGARSAGLIGKYDGGNSINGSTGWESFNADKISSYGIDKSDLYNAGVLASIPWQLGRYYDFKCTWDAETEALSTWLEGNLLYSVRFSIYPLSVEGDDFGFRSNVSDVYYKDISITVDQ